MLVWFARMASGVTPSVSTIGRKAHDPAVIRPGVREKLAEAAAVPAEAA